MAVRSGASQMKVLKGARLGGRGKREGGGRWEVRLEDGVLDLHGAEDKGALEVKQQFLGIACWRT